MTVLNIKIDVSNEAEAGFLLTIIHDLLHEMKDEGTLEAPVKYEADIAGKITQYSE